MTVRFLLDTDTCVFWLRGRSPVRDQVVAVGPAALGIASVTLAELRYGAACSAKPAANQLAIDAFIGPLTVVAMNETIAAAFGEIKADSGRAGRCPKISTL